MNISFFGYGKTTKAIAKAIDREGIFYDDNAEKEYIDDGFLIKPSSSFDANSSDIEILTPSINPYNPLLKEAKNPVSEYDLFLANEYRELRENLGIAFEKEPFTIWISGTNGKTTTTQMLTHLLNQKGAISGGNIGTPLADMDKNAPIWILETSSYTLHHTKIASPNIYLLLPITPDHLQWHGSKRAYIDAKLSPIERMREGELALVPKGLDIPDTPAWVVEYEDTKDLAKFFGIDESKIKFKAAFLLDALLALAVTKTLFDEIDYSKINSFQLDRHRQEEFRDNLGRLWVNDSKATNIDASIQALKSYRDRKIHLIIGGDDKGVDMSKLIDNLKQYNINLYTIGSNSQKLYDMAIKRDIPVTKCDTIQNAIASIDKNLKKDEVALLSPACASLDQFSSYAQRGDIFIETIQNLS